MLPGAHETSENTSRYVEKVDLSALHGIYVSQHFESRRYGVKMWCGYCREPLHYDFRHIGSTPFLTLMVKVADAHRATECPRPQGPFAEGWHPEYHEEWARMWRDRIKEEDQ